MDREATDPQILQAHAPPKGAARKEVRSKAGEATDEELMAMLSQGHQPALETLMHRYQTDIFRFCLHYLREVEQAKELTQETFVRVYTASSRFDRSRRFRPWVLCIARNLCLNELKRKKTVPMESLEEFASTARLGTGEILRSPNDAPDERAMNAERLDLLAESLDSLKDEAREVVVLRYYERMSAREIAEIIGSTEGAVRTKLHRILISLRNEFHEKNKEL